jgi:hypothetical protein
MSTRFTEKKIRLPVKTLTETRTVSTMRKPKAKKGKRRTRRPNGLASGQALADGIEWQNSAAYVRSLTNPFAGGDVRIPTNTMVPTCTKALRTRINLTPDVKTPEGAMIQLFLCPNATQGIWVKNATTTLPTANTWVSRAWDGIAELTAAAYCYRSVSMGVQFSYGGSTEGRGISMYAGRTFGNYVSVVPPATLYDTAVQNPTVQLYNTASQDSNRMVWAPAFDSELVADIAGPSVGNACPTGRGWRAPGELCLFDYNLWVIGNAPSISTDTIFADVVLNVEYIPLSFQLETDSMAIVPGSDSVTEKVITESAFSGPSIADGLFSEAVTVGRDIGKGLGSAAKWAAQNLSSTVGKQKHSFAGGLASLGISAAKSQGGFLGDLGGAMEQIHLPDILDAVSFVSTLMESKHSQAEVCRHRAAVLGGYPEQSPIIQRHLKTMSKSHRTVAQQAMDQWSKAMRPTPYLMSDVEPLSPVDSADSKQGYQHIARVR